VSRRQALALLRSWFATSPHDPPSAPESAYGANDAHHSASKASNGGSNIELAQPAPFDDPGVAAAEQAWQDDTAFMAWAEGASGAARIAMELRRLRTRAALRAVADLAATSEGCEGLVAGLRDAVQGNPSLLLQLRSLVAPRQ
jgi:hypothetical protein